MQSVDFFNFKEILGQVNTFLEGSFQHNEHQKFCPGRKEGVSWPRRGFRTDLGQGRPLGKKDTE